MQEQDKKKMEKKVENKKLVTGATEISLEWLNGKQAINQVRKSWLQEKGISRK
jgi:hypothetical protein